MKISVFGGSQPRESDTAYEDAYILGKMLAEAGHIVMTGGYIGTMEAVSRGAYEAGGHVIGVTCNDIENWRDIKPNHWINEEWRRDTLLERLQLLVVECHGGIALPGGPGTLAEIALMWNLMIVESTPRRPLVLVGNGWQSVFDQFFTQQEIYVAENQRKLVQFTDNVKTAVNLVEN